MSNISTRAIKFYSELKSPRGVGKEIGMINPYREPEILEVTKKFYKKFYADKTVSFSMDDLPSVDMQGRSSN